MINEIELYNKYDISNMSDDELDFIQQQIMNRKMNGLYIKMEQLQNDTKQLESKVEIIHEELSNKIDDMLSDNDKKLEVTINTYRVDKNKWGFESQADFGNRFRVSIGSKTVGKLFKVIGLAKPSKGATEPKREAIISKKATTDTINGYECFRWNHEKCLDTLEKWLKEHNRLEEFYSIDNEKELKKYIDNLYITYVD